MKPEDNEQYRTIIKFAGVIGEQERAITDLQEEIRASKERDLKILDNFEIMQKRINELEKLQKVFIRIFCRMDKWRSAEDKAVMQQWLIDAGIVKF